MIYKASDLTIGRKVRLLRDMKPHALFGDVVTIVHGPTNGHSWIVEPCRSGKTCYCMGGGWGLLDYNYFELLPEDPVLTEDEIARAVTFPKVDDFEKFFNV